MTTQHIPFVEAEPTELHITTERKPHGRIIAENIPYETYLEYYAEHACEWVKGYVIKMSPANLKHQFLTRCQISGCMSQPCGKSHYPISMKLAIW